MYRRPLLPDDRFNGDGDKMKRPALGPSLVAAETVVDLVEEGKDGCFRLQGLALKKLTHHCPRRREKKNRL